MIEYQVISHFISVIHQSLSAS